jgi:hypothetical protein
MTPHLLLRIAMRAAAVLLVGACALVLAQEGGDPPGRVGRMTLAEGAISFAAAGSSDWVNIQPNRPLTRGDRLWVDRASRGELHVGGTALRLGALTNLEILALDDQSTELNLTQGTLNIRIRDIMPGERYEIGTPNLAVAITQPGEYRIDVDPARDTTHVSVFSGVGTLYGENRETLNLASGQNLVFSGRNLAQAARAGPISRDGLDQWAQERDLQADQSMAARYVSRDVIGYQQLDTYGEWRNDPAWGPVWVPRVSVADWAPYRYGHWSWIAPWGWTWIDDAPWGFAPFHYGRWAYAGTRWAWVPGPRVVRPVYAPALVAFVGGNSGPSWSIAVGSGQPGVAWFPLGPSDMWRPGFRASRSYISNVNRAVMVSRSPAGLYANQQRPGAMTAVSADDFGRTRPGRGYQRVPDAELAGARVVEPPPVPGRNAPGQHERLAPAHALPPITVLNQPAPAARPQRFLPRGDSPHQDAGDDRPARRGQGHGQAHDHPR